MEKTQLERNEEALKHEQQTLRGLKGEAGVVEETLNRLRRYIKYSECLIKRIKGRIKNEQ